MLKNKYFYIFLFLFANLVLAQEFTFSAKASKEEVSVNERFSILFVLSYGQNNIRLDKPIDLPEFKGLHQLGESTRSNFQITNGNVMNESGIEVILVAEKEGEFKIGSATITINGKKYKTDPITINVKKGLKPKSQPGKRLQGAFLSAEISDPNPFLNQQVVLTVKLYARDYSILNRLRNYEEPDFANLMAKFVSEKTQDAVKQELVDGQTFVSQELARYIIFPQKSGRIEIDPFSIGVIVSGYYGAENIQLTSQPITLKVRELPDGKPKNFSGAIGNYKLTASLSKNETNANDAVNLEIEIIGSGNLNMIKSSSVEIPENIETYNPKKKDAFEVRPTGMKGKIVEDRILVPLYGGEYKIGPVKFNYFDPSQEKYVSLETKPLTLEVDGPSAPEKDSLNQQEVINDHVRSDSLATNSTIILPKKIAQVKDVVVDSVTQNYTWVWVLLGVLCLLLFLGLYRRSRKNKMVQSSELSLKQKKSKFRTGIQSDLVELKTLAQKNETVSFLSLQESVLTQIGMHYSQTNLAEFTENKVSEKLSKKYGDLAENWKLLLLDCKKSKYAHFSSETDLMQKYLQTEKLWKSFPQ